MDNGHPVSLAVLKTSKYGESICTINLYNYCIENIHGPKHSQLDHLKNIRGCIKKFFIPYIALLFVIRKFAEKHSRLSKRSQKLRMFVT